MQREIIGYRFFDTKTSGQYDVKGNPIKETILVSYQEDLEGTRLHPRRDNLKTTNRGEFGLREIKEYTIQSFLTHVNELSSLTNTQPFFQVLVWDANLPCYWIDHSWFKDNLTNRNLKLEDALNRFTDSDFPLQFTVKAGRSYMVDAIQWGFKPTVTKLGTHDSLPIPQQDKVDYRLNKEGIDYEWLEKRALFTCNGFVHRTGAGSDGIFIRNGFRTTMRKSERDIGIISFENLGELEITEITETNWIKPTDKLDHHYYVYLSFPEKDFTNRNLALVFMGHLLFLSSHHHVVKKVGPSTLRIDMQRFNYIRKIKDTARILSDNVYGMTDYEDKRWSNEEIKSEQTLRNVLNSEFTFLVEIKDCYDLVWSFKPLNPMNYPKRYWHRDRERDMLKLGDGRYVSYFTKDENGEFCYRTPLNTRPYKFDTTAQTNDEPYVTDYNRTTIWPDLQTATLVRVTGISKSRKRNNRRGVIIEE